MFVSGSGISSPITVKVKPDFKPVTTLGLKWTKLEGGNYRATDRGSSSDVYQASVRFYGKEADINTIIDTIELNRNAGSGTPNQIALSAFTETEQIFGMDVDYTGSINATVLNIESREQNTWKGYGVKLRLQALQPTFAGTPSFPTLQHLDTGYSGDSTYTIRKYDSYTGAFSYQDRANDVGEFTGVFQLSNDDMKAFRRYIATQRGATVSMATIPGVAYPFGTRSSGSYPYNVKIINFDDLGKKGVQWWKCAVTFAEVV